MIDGDHLDLMRLEQGMKLSGVDEGVALAIQHKSGAPGARRFEGKDSIGGRDPEPRSGNVRMALEPLVTDPCSEGIPPDDGKMSALFGKISVNLMEILEFPDSSGKGSRGTAHTPKVESNGSDPEVQGGATGEDDEGLVHGTPVQRMGVAHQKPLLGRMDGFENFGLELAMVGGNGD